jgi:hypothetical protein
MASPSNRARLHFAGIRLRNWRNFIDIDIPLQQRVFLVGPNASGKSNPIVKKEIVFRRGERILNRPDDDPEDSKDPARLTQTYLEQINANREFRDIAEFFASVRYLVPQLVRDPDRSLGRRNDPYGGDFLETVAQTPIKGHWNDNGSKLCIRTTEGFSKA